MATNSDDTRGAPTATANPLFETARFGKVELKNRIVMAPMTRNRSPKKVPGADVAEYYRRRIEGGVGLIITEGTTVDHPASSGYPNVPGIESEEARAGWKRVVDEVHAAGGAIIPQLWHCGSIRQTGSEPDPEVPGHGPSPIAHPFYSGKGQVPHEMTQTDIDDAIDAFARGAARAEALGFDGVELHGAHSYLIDQFAWEVTNQRTDKYGGNLENRTRFAAELVAAVRAAVSADFPICFRFSQWKQGDYRFKVAKTPEELGQWLKPLVEAGVDWFHASVRRFDDAEFEGSDLNLAGWTQKITGKPTITVGSVGLDSDFLRSYAGKPSGKASIDALIRRLENKEFELVALGRALLSDPDWPNKIRDGREDEIICFEPKHMQEFV